MSGGSYSIRGGDYERAGFASRSLKERLKRIGVAPQTVRRVMIAAYEAEMNVVIHANKGQMRYSLDPNHIEILVTDEGPGIPDIELAMQEGYSTAPPAARELGFGAGMGLPNIKKYSDRFEIQSVVGEGTAVRITIFLQTEEAFQKSYNSVHIVEENCRGCMCCLHACPTKAMRVRKVSADTFRPEILEQTCIDCTACIQACKSGVFTLDNPGELPNRPSEFTVFLSQALLVQFGPGIHPRNVIESVARLGFRDVVIIEMWAEALRQAVCEYASTTASPKPVIVPICPAVVNLIEMRFPALIEHLAPFMSPVEAARHSLDGRRGALVATCPSQQTIWTMNGGKKTERDSDSTEVISPAVLRKAVTPLVSPNANSCQSRELGEVAKKDPELVRVSGIRHVLQVLEDAETGLLRDISVLEPYICDEGCFGSPLLWENPHVAQERWRRACFRQDIVAQAMRRKSPFTPRSGLRLDPDISKAIAKLARIDQITKDLPGRDCGMCGSPTCASLAEDVVLERAPMSACPHYVESEKRK